MTLRDPDWTSSVVRIQATKLDRDYDEPWQTSTSTESGSALVVASGELLTTAHIVANATYIQVTRPGETQRAIARVKAVNHDCDLALLEIIAGAELLAALPAATFAPLPALWDEVALVGCAEGAGAPTVVRGVVSKISVERYTHAQRHLLAVALDAAITGDHGGGPAFLEGEAIGIVMQRKTDEDKQCEIVPTPIIETFLAAVRAGKSMHVPSLGITTQNLENAALRASVGLAPGESGVLVIQIDAGGSCDGVLECGDVLVAVAGLTVSNAGVVAYRKIHPVRYDAVMGEHHIGDRLALRIWRAGKPLTVEAELRPWLPLVARARYDQAPHYLVYGGLVFQPLTRDYLATWEDWWNVAPKEFLYYYYSGHRTATQREIVILSQILDDEINLGYAHLYNEAIARIDGAEPVDMLDFVTRINAARGIVRIETTSGGVIVMETEAARRATERILARHEIPCDRTPGFPAG